jgi:uncharacterized cupredoxin-like copper-binding protein
MDDHAADLVPDPLDSTPSPGSLESLLPADRERIDTLQRESDRRDTWTLLALGFAFITAVAGILAVGFAMRDDGGSSTGAAGEPIQAELSEFAIDLSTDHVSAAGILTIHNGGSAAHNVGVAGTDIVSNDIPAGGTATLDLSELEPGTHKLFCDISGHEAAGMSTELTVGTDSDGASGPAGANAVDHSAHVMTKAEGAAMDKKMMDSIAAFPSETEGRGNVALEPTVLADGTKHFELTAGITDWEVSPGKVVQAWAYNGMVPGPHLDLQVGDQVEVEITNNLPIGTDIHWHGMDVPNDQDGVAPITQELVKSGETYTYRFTVDEAAVSMYHAHAHAQEAVPNGMFGTIFVGEMPVPAGRTVSGIKVPADVTISQHVPMVLNDAGVIGLSLDGKSFPATAPIAAETGDWFEVSYYNEGLQSHPMHLHGFEQIVIAKDGEPLDHPYAADTVLVAPGERYTVLINASEPGTWVWHCHILNHVESAEGMFGMVTALVVS